MRQFFSFLVAIVLIVTIACSPTMTPKIENSLSPMLFKITEAFSVWDAYTDAKGEPDYTKDYTWIDDGLRYKYAILKNIASIRILKDVAKTPVFVSGPHGEDLNFESSNSFGHYNPEFITKVYQALKDGLKDDSFNKMAKRVYNNQLKENAAIYYEAYQQLEAEPELTKKIIAEYKQRISDNNQPGNYIQGALSFSDEMEKKGYNWYVADIAPGFWIRRKIDGTDKALFGILEMIISTFEE